MSLYPCFEFKEPKKIKFTTWDIETDSPINPEKMILIGFFNGKDYFQYDNFDNFLGETLKKQYFGYNHYAHFGGKFDFLWLLDSLRNYNYNYDIIDVNGKILQIEVFKNSNARLKGKSINFTDSYALLPKKLSEITESFKVEHNKISVNFFDTEKENYKDKWKHWKLFQEYLKYDCLGLYESIKEFEKIVNKYGGKINLTIASTSLNIFKNRYLKNYIFSLKDIVIGKDIFNKPIILKVEELIRDYYFGGRTEIFKRYIEYGFYYDVNSLYPFVMLQKMPISEPKYLRVENINLQKDIGMIHCTNIEFWKKDIIPLIPYKLQLKDSTKLIFPMGKFSGWIDLDLYRKAIKIGYKIDCDYGIIFDADTIFKDFILDFYQLRFLNETMKLVAKLIMNSLYGKWAQKRIKEMIIKYLGDDEEFLKTLEPYLLDENLYKITKESKSKHIIPSISSHITTLSQLELYKYIEKVGYNNIYYCDTDSLITTEKLVTSKNLGDIKLEYEINRGIFLLPKTYYIEGFNVLKNEHDTKIVMKGFTKTKYSYEDFYKGLMGDYSSFTYSSNKLFGFKESLKRKNKFVHFGNKINSIKSDYDKRILLPDRINTIPLTINNNIVLR